MSLSLKIFLVYLGLLVIGGYAVTSTLVSEVKPAIRQSTEETLVDTANLLAELLKQPLKQQSFEHSYWTDLLKRYGERQLDADIWGTPKHTANHRIYVTDQHGIVLLDSKDQAVGQDYSQWRDVYLTLRGKYGARTTREDPNDELSTVMHVAAPIKDGAKIIGVVTVAKPNRTVAPYINKAKRKIIYLMVIAALVAIVIGAALAWWFDRSMTRLQEYVQAVKSGGRASLEAQSFSSREMQSLAMAMADMRQRLDGKAYVESYVQSLTHELKSPLAGIRASLEILQQPLSKEQYQQFIHNGEVETKRALGLIDRVLELARIEKKQALSNIEKIDLQRCVAQLIQGFNARSIQDKVSFNNAVPVGTFLEGEALLVELALSNLLENAFAYCFADGEVQVFVNEQGNGICVQNDGPNIPEFALPRLIERFYSLPRPSDGNKSSGLGLNFVAEIAALHHGSFHIWNVKQGVIAEVQFQQLSLESVASSNQHKKHT